ncbi:hypothetical protein KY284_005048 [Solanum tuberosum]|nr:hypothetical protein KY284_005048 [Solanum tuberosum]
MQSIRSRSFEGVESLEGFVDLIVSEGCVYGVGHLIKEKVFLSLHIGNASFGVLVVSSVEVYKKVGNMGVELIQVLKKVPSIIVNGSDTVSSFLIDGGGVEEADVCITFTKPINPRFDFPKLFFSS